MSSTENQIFFKLVANPKGPIEEILEQARNELEMFEKSFVLDDCFMCVCVRARARLCVCVIAIAWCDMTETCQLSRRQLSVALSVILIEAQILQSHFQAGNPTLGQLVIWYFIKFGSLCLMTN